jgi:shikimate kinase
MTQTSTILLIGLRGSGKSTLGRLLAEQLGIEFLDLDALTLDQMGFATVTDAWAGPGEPAFREAEIRALRGVIEHAGVIALGGGTPMAPGGEELIRSSHAVTVYLRAEPELLRNRLAGGAGADRPSLTGDDPIKEIERVFNARDPKYRAIATHTFDLSAQEQPGETLERLAGVIR